MYTASALLIRPQVVWWASWGYQTVTFSLEHLPFVGRFNSAGNGNPLQYTCLENPMDRETWEATICGVAKSRTWLSSFTFTLVLQKNSKILSCECFELGFCPQAALLFLACSSLVSASSPFPDCLNLPFGPQGRSRNGEPRKALVLRSPIGSCLVSRSHCLLNIYITVISLGHWKIPQDALLIKVAVRILLAYELL